MYILTHTQNEYTRFSLIIHTPIKAHLKHTNAYRWVRTKITFIKYINRRVDTTYTQKCVHTNFSYIRTPKNTNCKYTNMCKKADRSEKREINLSEQIQAQTIHIHSSHTYT